ncbi:MAG: hypothetical protein GY772_15405 [bacterium]|nr:hypothetical protein [bacterium]
MDIEIFPPSACVWALYEGTWWWLEGPDPRFAAYDAHVHTWYTDWRF